MSPSSQVDRLQRMTIVKDFEVFEGGRKASRFEKLNRVGAFRVNEERLQRPVLLSRSNVRS